MFAGVGEIAFTPDADVCFGEFEARDVIVAVAFVHRPLWTFSVTVISDSIRFRFGRKPLGIHRFHVGRLGAIIFYFVLI